MSSSIVLNGKEYISSREATRISRYTGDYVGQMARDGRVQSVKKGKGRYVAKDEFLRYAFSQGKLKKGVYIPESFSFEKTVTDPSATGATEVAYTYEEDERELIPKLLVKDTESELEVTPLEEVAVEPVEVSSVVATRESFMTSWLVPALAVLLVFGTYLTFESFRTGAQPHVAAVNLAEDAKALVDEILTMVGETFLGIGKATIKAGELTREDASFSEIKKGIQAEWNSRHSNSSFSQNSSSFSESGDLVVFPSTNFANDEEAVEHIKETFSDEVKVIPGEGGNSGYIVPVFSDDEDERYRYVIVPEG